MIIDNKDKIIKHFEEGEKSQQFIGVENEKFLIDSKTKKRSSYTQIENVLNFLHNNFKWLKVEEEKNLIGLKLNDMQVTLEPGNQIELAGAKLTNIHEVCAESFNFQDQLISACKKFDLELLSVGYDPVSRLEEVPSNPKKRYKVMTIEMPKNGRLSLEMMYQTAGTQINLDYKDEKNFSNKFKLISYLVPLSIAIFANSSLKEKKYSNFLSYRSYVWQNTSRGGLPKLFLEEMTYEKYADFILNTPLLFLVKDKNYLSADNHTFKDFMENKINKIGNIGPYKKDLELHLSTIFTDVRLKQYLEIRSIDACEWDCHCASPAFYTGLIYGNLEEALDAIKDWKLDHILNAYFEAPRKGLSTELHGKTMLDWTKIFLDICKRGLDVRNINNKNGNNEKLYLKNIENIVLDQKTKAEKSINIA